jgi:hypothetical protein
VAFSLTDIIGQPTKNEPAKYDLLQLLLMHRRQQATDPKDLVYALVGLSIARDDPTFVLDYSRSIRDVYMSVVEHLITLKASLNVICATINGSHVPDLPSWVPNRALPPVGDLDYLRNLRGRHVSGRKKASTSISVDRNILGTRGFRVDYIQHVGSIWVSRNQGDLSNTLKNIHAWRELFNSVKGESLEYQKVFSRSLFYNTYSEATYSAESSYIDISAEALGAVGSLTL